MNILLKIGVAINSLTYFCAIIFIVFLNKIPYQSYQPLEKRIAIFVLEVIVVLTGYYMIDRRRVFSKTVSNLIGLMLIWPIMGLAVVLFSINNTLILTLLFIIGAASIATSVIILLKLGDVSNKDILIGLKSGESFFKSDRILGGIIIWLIIAVILLLVFLKL